MSYKCWKKSHMNMTTELDAVAQICWAACAGLISGPLKPKPKLIFTQFKA